MKKHIYIILLLLAITFVGHASNIVTGNVLIDGKEATAEYTIHGSSVWIGSSRNACIPQYSTGDVKVPSTITVAGTTYNVTGVSNVAFRLCSQITSVVLPEGVTHVGDFAFKGCANLTKLELPSTLQSIGTGAFIDLRNLSDLIVKAQVPPTWEYNDVFCFHDGGIGDTKTYENETTMLYVPNPEDYRNANFTNEALGWTTPDGWKYFKTIREVDSYKAEPYAIYNVGTLTFYCDGNRNIRSGQAYSLNEGETEPGWTGNPITKVVFASSFKYAHPTSTYKWMSGCENLTTIEGWSNLNTSEVTNMGYMFANCKQLSSIDLSLFDTKICTSFHGMFMNCTKLLSIDVSTFDTGSATNMSSMFDGCSTLNSLDISNFDFGKGPTLDNILRNCTALKTFNIPASITNASYIFNGCTSMEDVYYNGSLPFTQWDGNSDILAPEKATRFHVISSQLSFWTSKWGNANCTFVGDLGTESLPLLLYTAEDWNNLSRLVGNGVSNIHVKMMQDIKCDRDVVVATSTENHFTGTFDGNGHTLTLNAPDDLDRPAMAPFCYVGNATIKNLIVAGNIVGGIHSSGLVGYAIDGSTITIENCRVKAFVSARPNNVSGPHIGGFVGHGRTSTITIKGCLFDGILSTGYSSNDSYAGAFIGWCTNADGKMVIDCYERGTYSSQYRHVGMNYDEKANARSISNTCSYQNHSWGEAPHGYSVVSGTEGLDILFVGATTTYDVSGITSYGSGLMVDSTYYAGNGDAVKFGFNKPGYAIGNVKANGITPEKIQSGNGGGSADIYSFTIDNTNYTITADMTFLYIVLDDISKDNSEILAEHIDETTNVQLKNRTIYMDGNWNTLCLPFTLTEDVLRENLPAGYEVKTLESASFRNGTLTLNFADATTVEASLPCIIRWKSPQTYNLTHPVFEGVTITTYIPGASKFELGNSSRVLRFQGVFSQTDVKGKDNTVLYLGHDNKLYYPAAAMPINAFRAYFQLFVLKAGEPTNGVEDISHFVLNFGDEETGIASMENTSNTSDSWYTLDGRKLSGKPAQKGIYINNGVKSVVK